MYEIIKIRGSMGRFKFGIRERITNIIPAAMKAWAVHVMGSNILVITSAAQMHTTATIIIARMESIETKMFPSFFIVLYLWLLVKSFDAVFVALLR